MADSHLSGLKAQLQITAAQEPAWQAFTAAAKQQVAGMQAMFAQVQRQDAGTAPERLALQSTLMQQRGAAMATMSNALNALYAVLTPEQRAIVDQQHAMMGSRGMRLGPRAG
jgi:Spy/CpxP family protein refolding chaperone